MPAPAHVPSRSAHASAPSAGTSTADRPAAGAGLAVSLNAEGAAPDWVQLTPDDVVITGRDGRTWRQGQLDAVINRFAANGADLPVDIEHATQLRGAKGEPAPAVGWIKELARRGQALWARVEWNADGAAAIGAKAYRYLSPVFDFDRVTGEVHRIRSAGLTNLPNLELAALNRAGEPHPEETCMDPMILAALGLGPTATASDAVAAIGALTAGRDTALNRVQALEAAATAPDPANFVPRADFDLAMNRVASLEAAARSAHDATVSAAVDAAIAAGKVAPASRDYHVAACRQDGGLERFQAMVGALPSIVTPAVPAAGGNPPGTGTALNAEEQQVAARLGISFADFQKAKEQSQ